MVDARDRWNGKGDYSACECQVAAVFSSVPALCTDGQIGQSMALSPMLSTALRTSSRVAGLPVSSICRGNSFVDRLNGRLRQGMRHEAKLTWPA